MTLYNPKFRHIFRESAILTNSYVTGTVLYGAPFYNAIEGLGDFNQLKLRVEFTVGSLDSAEIKIEFAENTGDKNYEWTQQTVESVTSGSVNLSLAENKLTTSGVYEINIPINCSAIRVSVKGTGTVTGSSIGVIGYLSVVK